MTLAPWRSPLARALHRNRSLVYARYLQLATVAADGYPANRTVVFRGFAPDTNDLQFVTDARSEKLQHLAHSDRAEVCWYFPKTREQFRLRGRLRLIAADDPAQDLRRTAWTALSATAQLQFAWPHPKQSRAEAIAFQPELPSSTTPPETFCLLLLVPEAVDHLELRGDPQTRTLYHLTSEMELAQNSDRPWMITSVNP